jgi:hypothetical protein
MSLSKNSTLLSIDLSYNALQDDGAAAVAQSLGACSLLTLSLTSNSITDAGALSIAEMLKRDDCNLTSLNMANNGITDTGAIMIAEALALNRRLETLYIEENAIGDAGVHALEHAAKETFSVNDISEEIKVAVMMGMHSRLGRSSLLYGQLCLFLVCSAYIFV